MAKEKGNPPIQKKRIDSKFSAIASPQDEIAKFIYFRGPTLEFTTDSILVSDLTWYLASISILCKFQERVNQET